MKKSTIVQSRRLQKANIIFVVLLLGLWISNSIAQEDNIDFNALMEETQQMSQKAEEMTFVWWIPEEFWRVSFAQDPTVTEDQAEEFIEVLRPYLIFVVADGKIGAFGGITYKSESTIRNSILLIDNQEAHYQPLSNEKIDADTGNFLSMMKPVLANMLGPMGENLHFLLFPSKNKNGLNIAEAKKEGFFLIKLGENEFKWKLPLGSLLPIKICIKCKEKCSGAWNFCPWCGTELPK